MMYNASPMKKLVLRLKELFKHQQKKIVTFTDKKPFESFFIALGAFFILIVISNMLGTAKKVEKQEVPKVKQVHVYTVGSAPKMTVQAQIEKSGVIHLSSLTSGIIWSINKEVGQHVEKGETLITMSTNYQGGSTPSLQRQLAETQYQHMLDTYDLQKDTIKKQRDLADKTDQNADQLRDITDQSLNDMNSLINLNNDILSSLDSNIANLEATNVGGANDALILSTQEQKSQFLAANNQAKQASRSGQFTSAADKPGAELSNTQKDLTIKQLDLQEKMLDLNREISKIQLQIARVVEATMYPAAPFSGTIQRIFVTVGQQVNSGTELMVLSQDNQENSTIAIAYVSAEIAKKVSKLEPGIIHIGNKTISSNPDFVTEDAIQGSLYGVYFDIPKEFVSEVTNKGSIKIELPFGYGNTSSVIPYIPIDTVYQTKDQSYVYVTKAGKAAAKSVQLGNVFGSYVAVEKGLGDKDRIILDRNVIAGDRVTVQ